MFYRHHEVFASHYQEDMNAFSCLNITAKG